MAERRNWRNWRLGRTGVVEFVALVAMALFMAAIGAFNVDLRAPVLRYGYWLTAIVGGGLIGALIEPGLERIPALAARPRLRALAQILVMTVPITCLVWLITGVMVEGGLYPGRWLGYFPDVLVVDIVVVALAWLLRMAFRPRPAGGRAAADANPLGDKLPPRFARAALIAVEAEDHYLRVHTAGGETLVYMRFADALDALAKGDGLRVHRSWWVARPAVETVRWRNGRGELGLNNGIKAPVSRTYAADVRKVDWGEALAKPTDRQ